MPELPGTPPPAASGAAALVPDRRPARPRAAARARRSRWRRTSTMRPFDALLSANVRNGVGQLPGLPGQRRRFASTSTASASRPRCRRAGPARLLHQRLQRARDPGHPRRTVAVVAARPRALFQAHGMGAERPADFALRPRAQDPAAAGRAADPFRHHLRVEILSVPAPGGVRCRQARRAARRPGAPVRQRPVPQPLRQGDEDRVRCPRSSSGSTRTSAARGRCRSTSPATQPTPTWRKALARRRVTRSNGSTTTGPLNGTPPRR